MPNLLIRHILNNQYIIFKDQFEAFIKGFSLDLAPLYKNTQYSLSNFV